MIRTHAIVSPSVKVLGNYLELFKIHLCLYISLSAVFGSVMADPKISWDSMISGGLVLLLACGSAILNNIQDRKFDTYFLRTQNRCLPQKTVPIQHAVLMSFSLMIVGLSGLFIQFGTPSAALGLAAVISYNGLYTHLKKKSLAAILPGSISGMMPPFIGWVSTGSSADDTTLWVILIIFCLWQTPHFFMVLLKSNRTVDGEHKPFPCFTQVFSEKEMKLQILIWVSLYSLSMILFILPGNIYHAGLSWGVFINAIIISGITLLLFFNSRPKYLSFCFAAINLSILFFMGTGIFDKFIF